jgi:Outer membrane protein beta-barrel domain
MKKSTSKINFIVALILMNTLPIQAQSVEFGLRFMPTFSTFQIFTPSTGRLNSDLSTGYGIGGFVGYYFTEQFGVQGEIIYSAIAQKYKEVDVERQIHLKYVNIPLLFSLNTGKSQKINFNLVAGPQIGISAGSKLSSGSNNAILAVKKGDLGVAYGAGLDFSMDRLHLFRLGLGFRGVMGLLDISDHNTTLTTTNYYVLDRSTIKSYSGYLGLSILF